MADVNTLGHDSRFFSFRLKNTVRQPVYLHISAQPFNYDESLYIGELAVVKGIELYSGGPFVAAFNGVEPAEGDEFVLTSTNNRAGELQEWFDRVFGMATKGLLLPAAKELIVNGDFATGDLTGWDDEDTGGGDSRYVGGALKLDASGGTAKRSNSAAITGLAIGQTYVLSGDVTDYFGEPVTVSGAGGSYSWTGTGESEEWVADATSIAANELSFAVTGATDPSIDNISLRRQQDVGKTIVTAIPDSLIG